MLVCQYNIIKDLSSEKSLDRVVLFSGFFIEKSVSFGIIKGNEVQKRRISNGQYRTYKRTNL